MSSSSESLCPDCNSPLVVVTSDFSFCSKCLEDIVEDDAVEQLGRYRIERLLGEGSAGKVYLAYDPDLERRVAVKVLAEHVANQEELLKRFRTEARTLARLSHQNIVPVYAFEWTDDRWLLVMEYLGGQSLAEEIEEAGGRLSIEDVVEYSRQAASGLAAAHANHAIHRDLKPANLLLDDGRLKIADFGLAKNEIRPLTIPPDGQSDALTQTGLVVGTIPYMSPEQARGRPVDSRTDLFSLGVVIYEMATGIRPFRGGTTFTLMTSILTDRVPPLRQQRPDAPRVLEQIVEACLQKNRSRRRITAQQIADRLERLQRSDGTLGPLEALTSKVRKLFTLRRQEVESEAETRVVMAVLPPRHDQQPELDFVSFGIADGLTLRLGSLSEVQVRSGNSVAALRGSTAEVLESARLMGIEWLLTGSIVGSLDALKLKLELIRVSSEAVTWTREVRCSATELRAQQDLLVDEIGGLVLGRSGAAATSTATSSPEAELLVLKGLHTFRKLTPESLRRAAELFERATELDSENARAHGWLALTQLQIGWARQRGSIRSHALRAVDLDPTSGELHCILGNVLWLVEWDFAKAETSFRRALELSPNYSLTPHGLSLLLSSLGQHQEALRFARAAVELDPLNPITSLDLGRRLLLAGRVHEAEAPIRETMQLHPDFDLAPAFLGQVRMQQGQFEEATELFEKGASHSRWQGGFLGAALAACGRSEDAKALLDDLSGRTHPLDVQCAMVLTALGDYDSALDALETARQARDANVLWIGVEPMFLQLRRFRRFRQLARSIGLPRSLWGGRSTTNRLRAVEPATDDLSFVAGD